jgi:hypothetical protein
MLKSLPVGLEVVTEINLAIFYLRGTYYDVVKRVLGIRHVCIVVLVFVHDPEMSEFAVVVTSRRSTHTTTFVLSSRYPPGSPPSSPPYHLHPELLISPPRLRDSKGKATSNNIRTRPTRDIPRRPACIHLPRNSGPRGRTSETC